VNSSELSVQRGAASSVQDTKLSLHREVSNILYVRNIPAQLSSEELHYSSIFVGYFTTLTAARWSRDSAVGIATGYGLDD
jgi:hypothetical protein